MIQVLAQFQPWVIPVMLTVIIFLLGQMVSDIKDHLKSQDKNIDKHEERIDEHDLRLKEHALRIGQLEKE